MSMLPTIANLDLPEEVVSTLCGCCWVDALSSCKIGLNFVYLQKVQDRCGLAQYLYHDPCV